MDKEKVAMNVLKVGVGLGIVSIVSKLSIGSIATYVVGYTIYKSIFRR
jgi:hypothetical protein